MASILRYEVVGINKYQDVRYLNKLLRFARADAEEIARVLHLSNAFHVDRAHSTLHTDEFATHETVWRSLNRIFSPRENLDSNSIALFYFAGHGLIDPIDGDRILLGCYDVEVKNPQRGGISLNQIYNLLQRSSAGCSIAIIDACFSGAIDDATRLEYETPVEKARKAFAMLQGTGDKTYAIFAACRADQTAREEKSRGHGVFTDELLKGWRDGAARDSLGVVDINSLETYLLKRFTEDRQGPVFNKRITRPVILWQHEPPALGETIEKVEPLPPPPSLTYVGSHSTIMKAPLKRAKPRQERIKSLAVPIIIAMLALVACGVTTTFVEPLRQGFFAIVFGLGILLTITSFGINRIFGIVLAPIQFALLAGFSYHHFNWGAGITAIAAPLSFLAGLEPLFWTLIAIEMIFLLIFVTLGLMR